MGRIILLICSMDWRSGERPVHQNNHNISMVGGREGEREGGRKREREGGRGEEGGREPMYSP